MQVPCPDGFLIADDDPLRGAHLRVNDYLLAEEQRPTSTPFDLTPWRRLQKRELPGQTLSVLNRLRWLDEHDRELDDAHRSRSRLRTLLRVLYGVKAEFTEPELIEVIEKTTILLGRISPYGPIDRVSEYLKTNDLTPGLCRAMRDFQAGLREEMADSQASMQSLRQNLHMLLWMDEWDLLDPARCWSECIRRDFREMVGDRRIKWRALLKHLRGNAPGRMPNGWAKDARPLLQSVGIEDFRDRVADWFAPFRSGKPLPLTVAGSHVLKCMIWYCAVAHDDVLKSCALWLLDVRWRQKRNTEKSMVALAEFGIGRDELRARKLIKEESRDPIPPYLDKLRETRYLFPQNPQDQIIRDTEHDQFVVQGQLHFYRILRSSGRIERATDNAVLELDWYALPDPFRLIIPRECKYYSTQQLQTLGFLLMNDSVFAQCFHPRHSPDTRSKDG